ncbi:MAG: MarR family winged helix-turn-helix transcriptional regulator [Pseudomonadota bacterium]|nr:MarR family winged helix-turn-helix transcriptional regulator [Pseudomonadota bacterium]
MKHPYYDSFLLIERLHRYFLEVLKTELERQGIHDINSVQCLILYNIGDDDLTVGELTVRGYYLGSNVSYNVKKMVENGWLTQERSAHDKRSVRVRLSDKGKALRDRMATMFARQLDGLGKADLADSDLQTLNVILKKLERYWTGMIGYVGPGREGAE